MSTMALHQSFRLRHAPAHRPRSLPADARQGMFKRIAAAVGRWQQRHIEQEAGRFIADHGGRLTDDIERQLAEHFSGRGFPSYPSRPFRPFG